MPCNGRNTLLDNYTTPQLMLFVMRAWQRILLCQSLAYLALSESYMYTPYKTTQNYKLFAAFIKNNIPSLKFYIIYFQACCSWKDCLTAKWIFPWPQENCQFGAKQERMNTFYDREKRKGDIAEIKKESGKKKFELGFIQQ